MLCYVGKRNPLLLLLMLLLLLLLYRLYMQLSVTSDWLFTQCAPLLFQLILPWRLWPGSSVTTCGRHHHWKAGTVHLPTETEADCCHCLCPGLARWSLPLRLTKHSNVIVYNRWCFHPFMLTKQASHTRLSMVDNLICWIICLGEQLWMLWGVWLRTRTLRFTVSRDRT